MFPLFIIDFLLIQFSLRSPHSMEQSSLCYRAGSHQLFIYTCQCMCIYTHIHIYIYICVYVYTHTHTYVTTISQFIPPLSPQYPYIHSLCLCLYFCLAVKFICITFLHSIVLYCICFSISDLLHSFKSLQVHPCFFKLHNSILIMAIIP